MIGALASSARTRFRGLYGKSVQARWAAASQVVTSGANFATSVIIIRALGIDEFGRFSLAFMLLMILRNFLDGIVLNPIASIAPKLWGSSARAYRGFALAKILAFGLLTSCILFLIAAPLGAAIGSPWLSQLALALAVAGLSANFADFFRRYQFIVVRPAHAFAIDAVRFGIQILLILLLAFPFYDHFSARSAFYAMTFAATVASLVGLAFYGRAIWRPSLNRIMWPRHWNFVKWMTPSVTMEAIQNMMPQFVGGALLGEAALGLIRAAQQISNILNQPLYVLQQILPSMAAARLHAKGYRSMVGFLRKVGYAMSFASLLLGVMVVAVSGELAHLMGIAEVSRFATLLGLFMLLNFVFALRFPSTIFVNTVEDPMANSIASALGATISVVLSLLLIRPFGEIVVPIIYIVLVLLTWTFLHVWKNIKHHQYDKEFGMKTESGFQ